MDGLTKYWLSLIRGNSIQKKIYFKWKQYRYPWEGPYCPLVYYLKLKRVKRKIKIKRRKSPTGYPVKKKVAKATRILLSTFVGKRCGT